MKLIGARERLRGPSAMDMENVDDDLGYNENVAAVNKETNCYRCGGHGHMTVHFAVHEGDGKGTKRCGKNGKGIGKGSKSDGKGFGPKGFWERW